MPTSTRSILALAAVAALAGSLPGAKLATAADDNAPGAASSRKAVDAPTAPPKNLKKVGDHWTPYTPPDPESFPPGATLHIIEAGETLWGLADFTYNNPYLWPQLWDQNRYITDSHWIYPGDPVLVPARPEVVTQAGPEAAVPTQIVPQGQEGAPPTNLEPLQGEGEEGAATPEGPLQAETPPAQPAPAAPTRTTDPWSGPGWHAGALVQPDEVRCSGYIAEDDARDDLYIAENDEPKFHNIVTGSLVYLSQGKDSDKVHPGAVFSIVEREGTVLHPVSGKTEGRYYKRMGELKVVKVLDDAALATVTFACDAIRVGDDLVEVDRTTVPDRPIPAFDRLRVERNGKATGTVIHTKDAVVNPASGDIVQIDLGSEDGLKPGDFLTAFAAVRHNSKGHMPDYHYRYINEVYSSADQHEDRGRDVYPPLPVGQMVVMTTQPHTATVKIVYSIREVTLGSLVEAD